MSTEAIRNFCRIVRQRSSANQLAMNRLHELPGHQVGILRQELDSMIRAMWLKHCEHFERQRLAELFQADGDFRSINGSRITDAQMISQSCRLHGWSKRVYKFGCAFIHLSTAHDFQDRDPFRSLSGDDRREIIEHVSKYHSLCLPDNFGFADIVPILPQIFDKIRGNLECGLEDLESGVQIF